MPWHDLPATAGTDFSQPGFVNQFVDAIHERYAQLNYRVWDGEPGGYHNNVYDQDPANLPQRAASGDFIGEVVGGCAHAAVTLAQRTVVPAKFTPAAIWDDQGPDQREAPTFRPRAALAPTLEEIFGPINGGAWYTTELPKEITKFDMDGEPGQRGRLISLPFTFTGYDTSRFAADAPIAFGALYEFAAGKWTLAEDQVTPATRLTNTTGAGFGSSYIIPTLFNEMQQVIQGATTFWLEQVDYLTLQDEVERNPYYRGNGGTWDSPEEARNAAIANAWSQGNIVPNGHFSQQSLRHCQVRGPFGPEAGGNEGRYDSAVWYQEANPQFRFAVPSLDLAEVRVVGLATNHRHLILTDFDDFGTGYAEGELATLYSGPPPALDWYMDYPAADPVTESPDTWPAANQTLGFDMSFPVGWVRLGNLEYA